MAKMLVKDDVNDMECQVCICSECESHFEMPCSEIHRGIRYCPRCGARIALTEQEYDI
jgi:uncharacterized paraquat-inducible protein A